MDDKLDKVLEHIGEINVTLAKQEVSLSEHIRRTELLESKIVPLEKHHSMLLGVLAFLSFVATIAGIYASFN